MQLRGKHRDQRSKEKPKTDMSSATGSVSAAVAEAVSSRISGLNIAESSGQAHVTVPPMQFGNAQMANKVPLQGCQKVIWKPMSYGTVSGSTAVEVENEPTDEMVQGNGVETAAAQITSACLSKLFRGNLLENFTVDNSTYSLAQIRATFYPKFENEKSDQEVQFYSNSVILNCVSQLCLRKPNESMFYIFWTMTLSGVQNGVSILLLLF